MTSHQKGNLILNFTLEPGMKVQILYPKYLVNISFSSHFSCDTCDFISKRKYDLKVHMKHNYESLNSVFKVSFKFSSFRYFSLILHTVNCTFSDDRRGEVLLYRYWWALTSFLSQNCDCTSSATTRQPKQPVENKKDLRLEV